MYDVEITEDGVTRAMTDEEIEELEMFIMSVRMASEVVVIINQDRARRAAYREEREL